MFPGRPNIDQRNGLDSNCPLHRLCDQAVGVGTQRKSDRSRPHCLRQARLLELTGRRQGFFVGPVPLARMQSNKLSFSLLFSLTFLLFSHSLISFRPPPIHFHLHIPFSFHSLSFQLKLLYFPTLPPSSPFLITVCPLLSSSTSINRVLSFPAPALLEPQV